jgi:two-component system phosphate regulon response regulator PhoB
MARVLVADDDPVTRELIIYKLEAEGYDTVFAEDGTSALALAREQAPDIAVLDVHMPGMSGFDVCRMLRADPGVARIPVIMLTASVQEADISTGFDSGADDYVPKPFSPRELVSRIQAVLARAGA